jgi:protein NrfD
MTATISPEAAAATQDGPEDAPRVPRQATEPPAVHGRPNRAGWTGPTYYGRPQLKASPFENPVVGGYIFLAGLSGSAAVIAALADLRQGAAAAALVRRGRYLALLGPVLGAPLLIYDLHTPKRFYNMLRVAKATSPMSIGTWILMSFSGATVLAAAAQAGFDLWPKSPWLRTAARLCGIPAALSGLGLSFYTAALMSATSTPVWAASPRSLAIRYGSSSMASAAAVLALGEADEGTRQKLGKVEGVALLSEAAATLASHAVYRSKGVDAAFESKAGRLERYGAVGVGLVLPLGILVGSALLARHGRRSATVASVATLVGSALLRISMLGVGDVSASRPDISFRFSSPKNLR